MAVNNLTEFRYAHPEFADMDSEDLALKIYKANPEFQKRGIKFKDFADAIGVEQDRLARGDYDTAGMKARRLLADPAISLAKGAIDLGQGVVGVIDMATPGVEVGKTLQDTTGYSPKVANEFLSNLYTPQQKEAFRKVQQARGAWQTFKTAIQNPSTIAHSAIETLPTTAGMAAAASAALPLMVPELTAEEVAITPGLAAKTTKAARIASAAGEGVITAGQNVEQSRENSPTGTLSAMGKAVIGATGAITGLISYGSSGVAQKLGLEDVDLLLMGKKLGGAKGAEKGLIRRTVEGMIPEATEETLQSYQEQVGQNIAEGKPVTQGAANAAVMGGLTGAVMGGGAQVFEGKTKPSAGATPGGNNNKPHHNLLARELSDRDNFVPPEPAVNPPDRTRTEKNDAMRDYVDRSAQINTQAHQAATSELNDTPEPSDNQKESGRYKKGRLSFHGLPIAIENAHQTVREGTDKNGHKWSSVMNGHYGYFERAEGNDGDKVDVFVAANPDTKTKKAYIVDQLDPETGQFDEHKVIMGVNSVEDAANLYYSNYEDGWQGLGAINEVDIPELKTWLNRKKHNAAFDPDLRAALRAGVRNVPEGVHLKADGTPFTEKGVQIVSKRMAKEGKAVEIVPLDNGGFGWREIEAANQKETPGKSAVGEGLQGEVVRGSNLNDFSEGQAVTLPETGTTGPAMPAVVFDEKMALPDIEEQWARIVDEADRVAKKNEPKIKALEEQLEALKKNRTKKANQKKRQIKEQIQELKSESERVLGAGESMFISAQNDLNKAISRRLQQAGVSDEEEAADILGDINDILFESRAWEQFGPKFVNTTIGDVVDNVLGSYGYGKKGEGEQTNASTIRSNEGQVFPGETASVEASPQEERHPATGEEAIIRQRAGEGGPDLQQQTPQEPGYEEKAQIKKKTLPGPKKPQETPPSKTEGTTRAAKEPWEMPRAEWEKVERKFLIDFAKNDQSLRKVLFDAKQTAEDYANDKLREFNKYGAHKTIIQQALSEGKPVPRHVLEEYKGEKWADEALAKTGEEKPQTGKKSSKGGQQKAPGGTRPGVAASVVSKTQKSKPPEFEPEPESEEITITPQEERRVIDDIKAETKPVRELGQDHQILFLTGGPPSAGKTSMAASGVKSDDIVRADADHIKEVFGYAHQAASFHEASSRVAKQLANEAIDEGYNVAYDSLLVNFLLADKLIKKALDRGGHVVVSFQNIDAETSVARSQARILKGESERKIPVGVSVKAHNRSLPTFLELFNKYKEDPRVNFYLTDNNVDFKKPRLVFKQEKGKITIENKKLFDSLTKIPYHEIRIKGATRYERINKLKESSLDLRAIRHRSRQLVAGRKNVSGGAAGLSTKERINQEGVGAEQESGGQAVPARTQQRPEVEPGRLEAQSSRPGVASSLSIAKWVREKLSKNEKIDWKALFQKADEAFGGTQAEGVYTPKDAYDALELGVNLFIADQSAFTTHENVEQAESRIRTLKDLLKSLPTQSKRTAEQESFQQFSTPPPLAYSVAWVSNIDKNDIVLEPSAGVGGLAVFAQNAGAKKVFVNELSSRRAELLKDMGFDRVFTENAEHLNAILPKNVKPTVIIMNPPFSATAGRISKNKTAYGAQHIEQALSRLEDGGRLVAIVGRGMAEDRPQFKSWWDKIKQQYNVRANVGLSGKGYAKYGTSFDNQMIVIDKTGKTDDNIVTGFVDNVEDLPSLLKGVKDERVSPGEQVETKPASKGSAVENTQRGTVERQPSIRPPANAVGGGKRGGSNNLDNGANAGSNVSVETQSGHGLPAETTASKPGASTRSTAEGPHGPEEAGPRASRDVGHDRNGVQPGIQGNGGPESAQTHPGVVTSSAQTEKSLTILKQDSQASDVELTDAVYEAYRPSKVNIPGMKKHPGKLSESAAMATVELPAPTYTPMIPEEIVKSGKLSDAQLEAIVYAGQAHEQTLNDEQTRQGFFIGDGTGVGKGREIAGIMLDNWNRGRKKAVWLSVSQDLFKDAKRDIEGIGDNPDKCFNLSKVKGDDKIKKQEGILFATYGLLKTKSKKGNRRINQIVEWLGEDFDGVIAFDEAHKMRNAVPMKGGRGIVQPSQAALYGIKLQKRLPKARVVYISATGATEVNNLGYLERLGLWGEGTPFPTKQRFIESVSSGGMAAMEMVANNLKASGKYLARSLSYDNVGYRTLEHPLSDKQEKLYNELAKAWQIVLNNINEAVQLTRASGKDRGAILSYFWGAQQRFFNQIITSMQAPTVINDIKKQLAAGNAIIIQLVNTYEAQQDRAFSRLGQDDDLESLDLSPRDQLMGFLESAFPVQQYEQYEDEDGNIQTRPVVDSEGNPVENPEAVKMRDALLEQIGALRMPDSPLDMLLWEFGPKNIAEVTGRKRRIIINENGDRVLEKWSDKKSANDAVLFANDKKRILVFSDKGGTGVSYHADLGIKNQRRRIHYLLQAGWSADKAVQGLGRSHRSNQKQPPEYVLPTTNLKAQKRFLSTIARRLDQLGALTKGQRQTGSQGLFNARDNLENDYAKDAWRQLVHAIAHGEIEGMNLEDFEGKTGLSLTYQSGPSKGQLKQGADLPNIRQFLNRMLSLEVDDQNKVFEAFSNKLDEIIDREIRNGTLDVGIETLKAKKVTISQEQTVYSDDTGATAKYVVLDVEHDAPRMTYAQAKQTGDFGFYQNIKSGRIWVAQRTRTKTASTGELVSEFRLTSPTMRRQWVKESDLHNAEKWTEMKGAAAERAWNEEYQAAPKTYTEPKHLITGTLLPIWDRLPSGRATVIRVQTEDGRRLLGRLIPSQTIGATLSKLGAETKQTEITPSDATSAVLNNNATLNLANGWRIKRKVVSGQERIEIIGPDYDHINELKSKGVFTERIQFQTRFFIPIGPNSTSILEKVIKHRPISQVVYPDTSPVFSRQNKKPWPKDFPNITTHTTLSKLKTHPDYDAAKKGNIEAAIRVVRDLIKPDRIKAMLQKHPNAVVVAPHAEEAAGQNAIPQALAEAFRDAGFRVDDNIVQANKAGRTDKNEALRLAVRPEFDGHVEPGREYILVDDVAGQGGTFSELRHYIESNGGKVVDVSALTSSIFGAKLSIRPETVKALEEKFGHDNLVRFIQEFNTAGTPEALTEKEGRYILKQPSLDALRNRIFEEAQKRNIPPGTWEVQRPLSRITTDQTASGLSRSDVQAILSPIISKFKNAPSVQYVQSEAELPGPIRAEMDAQNAHGEVAGAWYQGTVYFVADNIQSKEEAQSAMLHEVFGHYGVEAVIDKKDATRFFLQVFLAKNKEARAVAADYGLNLRTKSDKITAAREVVARIAESGVKDSWVDKLIAMVRNGLRKIGINLKLSDAEIRQLIVRGARYIQGVQGVERNGMQWREAAEVNKFAVSPRYSLREAVKKVTDNPNFRRWFGKSKVVDENGKPLVVYHGTFADFSIFDKRTRTGIEELGPHFGTNYQAESRLENQAQRKAAMQGRGLDTQPSDYEGAGVMPVYLSIKNPLIMPDAGTWNASSVATILELKGKETPLTKSQIDKIKKIGYSNNKNKTTELREYIESLGYDGVKYYNKHEGGGFSYIAFHPTQIKSIYNTGTFSPDNPDIRLQRSPVTIYTKNGATGFATGTFMRTQGGIANKWYSAVANAVKNMNFKSIPGKDLIARLKKTPGVKQAEIDWIGLEDWLKNKPKVTKQEVLDFIDTNNVQIKEVVKGASFDPIPKKRFEGYYDTDGIFNREGVRFDGEKLTFDGENEIYLTKDVNNVYDGDGYYWVLVNDELHQYAEKPSLQGEYGEAEAAVATERATIFNQYQEPGGENYREILLTMPETRFPIEKRIYQQEDGKYYITGLIFPFKTKKLAQDYINKVYKGKLRAAHNFTDSHWEEPNVLAHVRINDRTDTQGRKILFVEEIQSDWAQKGRKKGFSGTQEGAKTYFGIPDERWAKLSEQEKNSYVEEMGRMGVPNMPYKHTQQWTELVLKHLVRYAAENGYDAIAWTPGDIQAARYDLSKQVDSVRIARRANDRFDLYVKKDGNVVLSEDKITKEELSDTIGKDLTDKAVKDLTVLGQDKEYSGLDLKIGGEGMKAFYDKIVPNIANKFFNKAKWGKAKVRKIKILTKEAWSLPITPEMRSKVLTEGMPLFLRKKIKDIMVGDTPLVFHPDSDMGHAERAIRPPHWLAKRYQEFRPLYERQRQRIKERMIRLHNSLKQTETFWHLKKDQTDELATVIFNLEGKRIKGIPHWLAPKASMAEIKAWAIDNDVMPDAFTDDELQEIYAEKGPSVELEINKKHYDKLAAWLEDKGVSRDTAKAYVEIRKSLDEDLLTVWNSMNSMDDVEAETVSEFRRQMFRANNYFPHKRYGNYYIQITDPKNLDEETGKPEILYREHFSAPNKLAARVAKKKLAQILDQYPQFKGLTVTAGKVNKLSEEVYEIPIPVEAIDQVVNAAIQKITDPETRKTFEQLLPKATAEVLKSRGWAAHAIRRKNIPGFEKENIKRVLFDYKAGLYGWLSKMEASKDFTTALSNVDATRKPILYGGMKRFAYDMLANADEVDRAVQSAKAVFFVKYLGGNVKTAALNLTQNLIAGVPRLGMETRGGSLKWFSAAGKHLVDSLSGKSSLTGEENKLLEDLFTEGTTQANYVEEVTGQFAGGPKTVWNKTVKFLGLPMTVAERFNRVTLALAAFNVARKGQITNVKTLAELGLKRGEKASYEQAKQFAETIVDDAHFVYGKTNRPEVFRGTTSGKVASSAYTFRTFTHNLVNLWELMWKSGGPGKRAVLKSLAATIAIGGISSIPLYKTFMHLMRQLTGDDWDEDKLLKAVPPDANWLRDIVEYGFPAALGVSIGGSVGMELPVFERIRLDDSIVGQVWSGTGEILGIPGAIVEDAENAIRMINSGQQLRALEYLLPVGAANVLKAVRMNKEGLYTRSGRPIVLPGETAPRRLTTPETIGKLLGFQPVSSQKAWDLTQKIRDFQVYKIGKQGVFADNLANALRGGDVDKVQKIIREIYQWNVEQVRDGHPEYVINITQALRARLRGQQPPKYLRGVAMKLKKRMMD